MAPFVSETDEWFRSVLDSAADRSSGLDTAYVAMQNAGVLSKVTLHTYVCGEGCGVLARVITVDGLILCNSRNYKLSPGKNQADSVESARRSRTLDGNRHWPSHTVDIRDMAEWDGGASVRVACRHVEQNLPPAQVLETVEGIRPGHPGKPTRL